MTKLCFTKPRCREFPAAVSQILSAEYAQLEHLFRRQLRLEIGMKVSARGLDEIIRIALLHQVVDFDTALLGSQCRPLYHQALNKLAWRKRYLHRLFASANREFVGLGALKHFRKFSHFQFRCGLVVDTYDDIVLL